MRVRLAILSASAVDAQRGLMVQEHAEAQMSAAMSEVAESRVFAVDSSKFGLAGLVALLPMRGDDRLVTDAQLPAECRRALGAGQVVVV
jgi:DeoR/GlpR family transcriptional regulator of sugar metabolism